MMKLLVATVFLCTFSTHYALAQKNFKPATIELTNGEKMDGFVDYRNWERNPEKISFKKTETASVEELTLQQLNAFRIANEDTYIKAVVWKDVQSLALDKLDNQVLPNILDTVFLRVLVEGEKINLYELVDDRHHYFIKPQKDTLQELQYKRLLVRDGVNDYYDYKIYRDQLKKLAIEQAADKKLLTRIANAKYDDESLSRIIHAVNGNNSLMKNKTSKPQLFASAGFTYTTIDFAGDAKDLTILNESADKGYTVSLGMDIMAKRSLERAFLRVEIKYGSANYEGEAEVPSFWAGQWEKKEYEVGMKMITPTVSLAYKIWAKENLSAYLGFGGGVNFTSYSKNRYTTTNLTSKEVSVKENYKAFEKAWPEGIFQAGVIVNKRIEARLLYRAFGSFEDYVFIKTKNNMVGITAGWRF